MTRKPVIRDLVYVDTETTGFDDDPDAEVFELTYAVNYQEPHTLFFGVEEVNQTIDELTKFTERGISGWLSPESDFSEFVNVTKGQTMVAANPPFDRHFIKKSGLWNFHHRSLDIESYAMAKLGLPYMPGMVDIFDILTEMGFSISEPDHTSRGDVIAMRQSYDLLRRMNRPRQAYVSLG